jgi:rhodanese-related sulfurtransferase
MTLVREILKVSVAGMLLGASMLLVRGMPQPLDTIDQVAVCKQTPSLSLGVTSWIEPSAAHALLDDPSVFFVDCRPRDQFQAGHITGALSMPSDAELPGRATPILREARTLIAYCNADSGCESSQRLAARLRELGLSDVRVLKDGMPAWLLAGYPAESGATCRFCSESTQ